jgi:hypothetical protein
VKGLVFPTECILCGIPSGTCEAGMVRSRESMAGGGGLAVLEQRPSGASR